MTRHQVGLGLVGLGALLVLLGATGLLTSDGSATVPETSVTSTSAVAAPTSTSSTSSTSPEPSTTAAPASSTTSTTTLTTTTSTASTTSTTPPSETVEEFVPLFASAIAAGDVQFLLDRLHPAVVDGYSETLCRGWIEDEILLLRDYRITGEVTGPSELSYTSPGGSGVIEDAYSVPISFTFRGQSFDAVGDFASVDGTIRWLGQCQ